MIETNESLRDKAVAEGLKPRSICPEDDARYVYPLSSGEVATTGPCGRAAGYHASRTYFSLEFDPTVMIAIEKTTRGVRVYAEGDWELHGITDALEAIARRLRQSIPLNKR